MASSVMLGGGTTPAMAAVKLSAASMSASAGVMVGMVRYLCLKSTVLQVRVCLVSLIPGSDNGPMHFQCRTHWLCAEPMSHGSLGQDGP